ncbi:hypothetical protein HBN50_05920 [Halobacteriovorax sp. GB3]|uniref:nitrilase-related carbon-nitrogen hydrolase n=1 Tax=Halobacteriovorax sp. GB3 TaxID=2719615 RepID=UPI00235EC60D|nr:nitrilase-related carbon-nitrogen hydrolase [Halobacteriovorax sp. GB3]MDD0852623.1 hypothetical protein [Halobacteriovorax sp. GB3]
MKVSLIQLTSVLDYKKNLEKLEELLQVAKDNHSKMAFLPECFYSLSDGTGPTPYLVSNNNEHYKNIQNLAKRFDLYLIGGSAATESEKGILNRAYNFSPQGEDLGHYDKRYLFSCDIVRDGKRKKVDEGDIYTRGQKEKLIDVDGWKIGLGICFDIRFPELARSYRNQGADILTFSSAFTVPTGQAHWHLLNRARAVENQSYVISSAQWGNHNERVNTFGHSLCVDPWGDILCDNGEAQNVMTATLSKERIQEVRQSVIMG